MARLVITAPDGDVSYLELGQHPIVVGREGNVDILLNSPEVSRKHARIVSMQGEYVLEDLGSANGTTLNGHLIKRPTTLKKNALIQIATYSIALETGESSNRPSPALVGQGAPVQYKTFILPEGDLDLGRVEGNALVIADSSISRKHAQLAVTASGVTLSDLGSSNGTRVNGQPIDQITLQYGDLVQFGNVVFKFMHTGAMGQSSTIADFFSQLKRAQASYKLAATVGLISTVLLVASLMSAINPTSSSEQVVQSHTLQRSFQASLAVNLLEAENFERQGEWTAAVSAYQTVLAKSPIHRRAIMGLAASRRALQNRSELQRAKQAIASQDPESAVRNLLEISGDGPATREAKALLPRARKSAAEDYLRRADQHCKKRAWLSCQKDAVRVLTHEPGSQPGRKLLDLSETQLEKAGALFIPAALILP